MIDLTTLGNTTGSAINNDVAAVDAPTPTSIAGTPFVKALVDNDWGFDQALLEYAGDTADGVTESKTASQKLEALKVSFSPPGTIFMGGWNADPATLGYRLVLLDGSGILVADYADLVAACYVGDGNNAAVGAAGGGYYKASDAAGTTPSTSGTYLILPDMRGAFIRGEDTAGAVDPSGASRYLGDFQDWAMVKHGHGISDAFTGNIMFQNTTVEATTGSSTGIISGGSGSRPVADVTIYDSGGSTIPSGNFTYAVTGMENRPPNITVKYAVRY